MARPSVERTMLLKMYIANNELREKYLDAVVAHNNKLDNDQYPDSGFDLFLPDDTVFKFGETQLVDLGVKCAACWLDEIILFLVQPHLVFSLVQVLVNTAFDLQIM